MTMLDRMRRHKGWLKWSLALVVLTFVVFYIPGLPEHQHRRRAEPGARRRPGRADHRGHVHAALRDADERVPAGLRRTDERAAPAAARHRSPDPPAARGRGGDGRRGAAPGHHREQRRGARAHPQHAGVPGRRTLRRRTALPAGAAVQQPAVHHQRVRGEPAPGDHDREAADLGRRLDHGHRRRGRRTSTAAATRRSSSTSCRSPPTRSAGRSRSADADLAAHFDKNKESYRIGEKRRIKYALVDVDQVRASVTVPDADVEAFYKQNLAQYTTPAQARASHILFKTEGKDENAVQGPGRRGAEEGPRRRGLRRAREAVLRRRFEQGPRRRSRTTSARAAWCPSSKPPRSP